MKQVLTFLLAAFVATIFTACAGTQPQANNLIKDTSKLKPSPLNESAHYYLKKGTDFSKYSTIFVPRVMIIENKDQEKADVNLTKGISDYFTSNLNKRLNNAIKNNPGMESLVLDVSITSLDVGFEAMKAYNFIPIGLALKAISRGTGIEERQLNVALALRLTDKRTKEVVALVVDSKVQENVKDLESLTLSQVKPLLDQWIKLYETRLKELSQGKYKDL